MSEIIPLVLFFSAGLAAYTAVRTVFLFPRDRARVRGEENIEHIKAYLTGCFGDAVYVPAATVTLGNAAHACTSCRFWGGGGVRVYITQVSGSIENPGGTHVSICVDETDRWVGPNMCVTWSHTAETLELALLQSRISEAYLPLELRNHGDTP